MDQNGYISETTSRDIVGIIFRRKGVILTTVVTAMTSIVLGLLLKTPLYQAEVKMLISGQKQAQAGYYVDLAVGGMRSNTPLTVTQSEIVSSDPVLERVVSVLGLAQKPFDYEKRFCAKIKKPIVDFLSKRFEKKISKLTSEQKEVLLFRLAVEDLRQRLKVEPLRDTDIFHIRVKDFNPLGAAVMANVISRSYVIFDLEQQLAEMQLKYKDKNQSILQLKEAIAKMSEGLNGARLAAVDAIGPATVKIIQQAKVPIKPSGLPRIVIAILGFIMSFVLGVLLAFVVENTDQTLKSVEDTQNYLKIDCLGTLSRKRKEDEYEHLAEKLSDYFKDRLSKRVVFTSAMPDESVSFIVGYLGQYLVESLNKKVLIIDCALKNSPLLGIFKLRENNPVLKTETQDVLQKSIVNVQPGLDILALGKLKEVFAPRFSKIFSSAILNEFLMKSSPLYEVIIFNTSALSEAKETKIICSYADRVILVVGERKVRRQVVKNALHQLKGIPSELMGFILTNRSFAIPQIFYNRL